jgi:hypothetical protein
MRRPQNAIILQDSSHSPDSRLAPFSPKVDLYRVGRYPWVSPDVGKASTLEGELVSVSHVLL